jgi:hypothetical protein
MNLVNQVSLNTSAWMIIKIAVVFGLVIYIIFAFVVLKQVNLMTDTLEVDFEKPIKAVAIFHFIFAVFVLVFALLA